MALALIGLILFLAAPLLIGPALAWLRIRDEQAVAPVPPGGRPARARAPRRAALPPAA